MCECLLIYMRVFEFVLAFVIVVLCFYMCVCVFVCVCGLLLCLVVHLFA